MPKDFAVAWWKVLVVFLRDSAVPAAVAAAYVWWAQHSAATPPSWPDMVQRFGVSYFFLMWFVGQFSRVAKRLDDRGQLQQIQADIATIKSKVTAAPTAADVEVESQATIQTIVDPTARALMSEALSALQNGLHTSALVTAAVAFEHAVRSRAARLGIESGKSAPVARTLDLMTGTLGSATVADLRGLWRARNRVVHLTEEQVSDPGIARSVFQSFLWGVRLLSE